MSVRKGKSWKGYDKALERFRHLGDPFLGASDDFGTLEETNKQLYSRDGKFPMGSINPKRRRRR